MAQSEVEMNIVKLVLALGFGLLVSACAQTVQTSSEKAPQNVAAAQLPSSISVSEINVVVPFNLRISEGNGYYPYTDIVWRGEPIGDRRDQIREIFEAGFGQGTRNMKGDTPLILDVELKRFHSVTDRTRLSVGGVHNMIYNLTIRDARSGAVIVPTREVESNLKAYGGIQAIKAEQRGQTQKVRIIGFLRRVIQEELGQPITQ